MTVLAHSNINPGRKSDEIPDSDSLVRAELAKQLRTQMQPLETALTAFKAWRKNSPHSYEAVEALAAPYIASLQALLDRSTLDLKAGYQQALGITPTDRDIELLKAQYEGRKEVWYDLTTGMQRLEQQLTELKKISEERT